MNRSLPGPELSVPRQAPYGMHTYAAFTAHGDYPEDSSTL